MHELSLTENVLEILQESAERQGFSRVRTVCLEIGALSCIEPEALRFCFDVVMKGTLADGAQLQIVRTDGVGWCGACERQVPVGSRHDPCPRCGGFGIKILLGGEMRVRELEVE